MLQESITSVLVFTSLLLGVTPEKCKIKKIVFLPSNRTTTPEIAEKLQDIVGMIAERNFFKVKTFQNNQSVG